MYHLRLETWMRPNGTDGEFWYHLPAYNPVRGLLIQMRTGILRDTQSSREDWEREYYLHMVLVTGSEVCIYR